MSPFQRMRRLCPWKPHVKAGNVGDRHQQKAPQFAGMPGWLLLSHSEDGSPLALFVDKSDKATPVQIVVDERLCSDTVIRVTQIKPDVFVACDIRWLNGICVYEKLSYDARRALLASLLEAFHQPDLTAVLPYDDAPVDALVRGWEWYDAEPGTMGVFLPAKE